MADRESALRAGEQRLREWGVAPDAGMAALQEVAGRDAAADLAIAARLGALTEPASVEALLALERSRADRLLHKEVRRSLYRLSQRGVAVPAAEPPVQTPRPAIAAPAIEGYLSPVDGAGDQLVWLVRAVPGGILHLFSVVNDPEGLRDVGLTETTRKSLREARDELRARHDLRMVEADWHYCDFVIWRGQRWVQERGHARSGDYAALRRQLTTQPPPAEAVPPIRHRLDADAVRDDARALIESPALLDEPELRTWILGPDVIAPYLAEMDSVRDSPLVLNELQQRDRFVAIVKRATEELFGGERQASWVRRLEEMAYFFDMTGRPERARSAYAAALALAASTRGGSAVPFCEELAQMSILGMWQAENRRAAEEARSSLVLTPQQAAMEAERRRRER